MRTTKTAVSGGLFGELALGRYLPGTSPLHRSPAWGKGVLLALLGVAAFWLQSATAIALLGCGLAGLARLAKIPQADFWRSLRPLLLLAALTVAAGAFLSHPESAVWQPAFSLTGLQRGALYAARLLVITLLTTLFFLTTQPNDAISLGVRVMAPLRLVGIDAKELSLLVHLAYRFVPLLDRELKEMEWGRRARNLPTPVGLPAKARLAVDTMVSVVIGALHRAETTAVSLEQRGLLESWRPAPLTGGQPTALWPLVTLTILVAALLHYDAFLL